MTFRQCLDNIPCPLGRWALIENTIKYLFSYLYQKNTSLCYIFIYILTFANRCHMKAITDLYLYYLDDESWEVAVMVSPVRLA